MHTSEAAAHRLDVPEGRVLLHPLFGPQDAHRRIIEKRLGVRISAQPSASEAETRGLPDAPEGATCALSPIHQRNQMIPGAKKRPTRAGAATADQKPPQRTCLATPKRRSAHFKSLVSLLRVMTFLPSIFSIARSM